MIHAITLSIVIAIAVATILLVLLSIRQGRRTTHVEQRVHEVHGLVQGVNARLDAVTIKCNPKSADNCRLEVQDNVRR